MIPVTQTIMHNPDEGQFGNCFSAVLASLLHIPIEDVPVFKEKETWKKEVNEFLRPYNLAFFDFMDYPVAAEFGGVVGLYHEQAGNTVRGNDCSHACVAVDGKVVHDPHPNGSGLEEIYDYSGVFVCLEPWQLIELRRENEDLRTQLADATRKLEEARKDDCAWTDYGDDNMPGTYKGSCGILWTFTEGGIEDNECKFCPRCGGKIISQSIAANGDENTHEY